MRIQILADKLISQISAGEVIERPASVVKELVENALDAGATNIHILAKGGGRDSIQVSDNGSGIRADEVNLAFTRHATSKIQSVEDLERILTLGFRGEALASIVSVSRVAVTTRHRDEAVGMQLRIEGGEIINQQNIGAPAGTIINVENLFYNTPARLKFLKAESTEKRQITTIITRYAMAYPDVRFTLEQDGREMLRTTGSGELADVLVQVFGLESFKQMHTVEAEETDAGRLPVKASGFVGSPELNRADRGHIILFVNGRWINDSRLSYAVTQAYHGMLPNGRYPVAVLMIEVPPHEVDVNVHPAKAEVRFRDIDAVFTTVQRAVRASLIVAGGRPQASNVETGSRQISGWGSQYDSASQMAMGFDDDESDSIERSTRAAVSHRDYSAEETAIPEGAGRPARPRTLPPLRVVGQVGATYIIAEGPSGLYLIDQHAAHRRLLYETLHEGAFEQVALNTPQTVELTSKAANDIETHLDVLRQFAFDVELFGQNTFQIRALPDVIEADDLSSLFRTLAEQMSQRPVVEAICLCLSEYGAVKTGQVLSQDDMQAIIRRLERARDPMSDPNGRPTLIHMTGDQLARQFGR